MDLISFNCTSCQQLLKVGAENAGKQAKCPRCGTALVIPGGPRPAAAAAPPPYPEQAPYGEAPRRPGRPRREDDDDFDRGRPRRRPDEYEGGYGQTPGGMSPRKKWALVRVGVLLVAIGACITAGYALMLALANLIVLIAVLGAGMGEGTAFIIEGTAFIILGKTGFVLAFLGALTAMAGYVFCLFVPNRNGTLPLAIVVLSLGVVNFILALLVKLVPVFGQAALFGDAMFLPALGIMKNPMMTGGGYGGAFAFSIIIILLNFGELIVFPIFMWAANKAARARWVAGRWMGLVIYAGISAGMQLLNLIMLFVLLNSRHSLNPAGRGLATTVFIINILASLVFLGQMIWYLILLFQSRDYLEP